jgi:DNA-binding transcriptional ArsR family regulator
MRATTLDHVLAAIADPTRRAILQRLTRGPARITDLAEPFDMSFAAVSKHIRTPEHSGARAADAPRTRAHAHADALPLRQVVRCTFRYEQFWNEGLDRLETFFEQKGREN